MRIRGRSVTPPRPAAGHGFTLVEVMVTLAVASGLLTGIVMIFQVNSNIARLQMEVSGLQQSSRVAQYDVVRNVRMLGRGGLPHMLMPAPLVTPPFPGRILPDGVALEVRNNVPVNTTIAGEGSATVLAGTDVLTIRGVFSTPVYQVGAADFDPASGRVTLNYLSPSGVPQDLEPLADAIAAAQAGEPEALIMLSPLGPGLFAVVEITGGAAVSGTVDGEDVTLQARLEYKSTGGIRTAGYAALSPEGRFPPQMSSIAFVGILEEYRYFIREVRAVEGDGSSDLIPELSRARFYPLSDVPHPSSSAAQEMIADNILDLQVALGVDTNGDGTLTEGTDTASRGSDEWLFNSTEDVIDDPDSDPATWVWSRADRPVSYLRITTLARSDRRDTRFVAPPVTALEDHLYNEPEIPVTETARLERNYRRRQSRTVVDLRNLG